MILSLICICFRFRWHEVSNEGREVGTIPCSISANRFIVPTWASYPYVPCWGMDGGNWKYSWIVLTTLSSSSIWSPYNGSLASSVVYQNPSKSPMNLCYNGVHLHFTLCSVPCGACSSTVVENEGPSSEYFCLYLCGLVLRTMESSTTGIS